MAIVGVLKVTLLHMHFSTCKELLPIHIEVCMLKNVRLASLNMMKTQIVDTLYEMTFLRIKHYNFVNPKTTIVLPNYGNCK